MPTLTIAVAQINAVVGDIAGNLRRLRDAALRARAQGAQLVLTPELALVGYPPEDLLLRPDFHRSSARALQELAESVQDVAMIVGHPLHEAGRCFNGASLLRGGRVEATYRKLRLPNSEVFDEERYFESGDSACVVSIAGVQVGINICEDVWQSGAAERARAAGAELLLVLNASPFHMDKQAHRHEVVRARVAHNGNPIIYANLVGGQDELVFDGASFALDRSGELVFQAPAFEEAIGQVVFADGKLLRGDVVPQAPRLAAVYSALKLGVRDYLDKNGFPGAIIGLSGGIDSALTVAIAADALGPDRVRAVMMPSPYTAAMSLDDSRALVAHLNVRYEEIPIQAAMDAFETMLAPQFRGLPADTTEENLQARIRGTLLMALSNKSGDIVLTTGNKSEMAVGYATLYGDMAGGFAGIKDIPKTMVYQLAEYRNTLRADIPHNILTRAPSAELRPDQTDQDSLPPYAVLDAIVEAYMERDLSPRDIIAAGYAEADVRRVVGLLRRNEYKRRQAPVGIRITRRGFGKDWRYPITNRYQDEF
ncbi:MAG TPA: NAD+ synthase [Rhodocyclaceae bacterium]|nr:NAD+ synthase [Rhodocyclaceae bacterium]